MSADFIPYYKPDITDQEIHEVVKIIKKGWITRGPKTDEFEKKFANYLGAKHAIAMNSCTAALHVALLAAGIGSGDEVITSPMTFTSSVNTIIHCGAKPTFVDIDPNTGCINPDLIEERINNNTKAIVPIHYSGQACNMEKINTIAKRHCLFVSEDAAHALCTKYKGKLIGSNSMAASFSFYATKNLTTGEGGMLVTNRNDIAEKARIISYHGMSNDAWDRYAEGGSWMYDIRYPGFKYNMSDIQSAMGIVQMKRLEDMQKRRLEIANIYNEAFSKILELEIPMVDPTVTHCWHLYVIRINHKMLSIDRNLFINELKKRGIGTSVHFIPVHLMSIYKNKYKYKTGDFPNTEDWFNRIISLPLYSSMSNSQVRRVINVMVEIIRRFRLKN